ALDAAFLRNGGWGLWHFGGPAVRQLQDIVRPTSTHPKKRPVPTQTNESSEPGPVFPRTPPQQAHSLAQDGRRRASRPQGGVLRRQHHAGESRQQQGSPLPHRR